MEPVLEKMSNLEESDIVYEDYLKVFDEFIALNNQKILNYMLGILFERPLQQYRIEVITNNAGRLGYEMYSNTTIDDIVPRIFEEIFSSLDNKSRLESLIYCICQLSVNIIDENIMKFITDCLEQIKKHKEKSPEKLMIVLDIMKFFFQNSLLDIAAHVPEFLYYFIPFLFVEKPEMATVINSLLKTQQKDQCSLFLNEFYNKLASAFSNRKDSTSVIYALNQDTGLDPYINILINSLVYGLQNDCETALKFYQLVFSTVKGEFISPHTLKLMGPLIRVANYNYDIGFKMRIIEVLGKFHEMKLPIKAFESQLLLTYFRLIKEAFYEKEILKILVENFLDLFTISMRKDFMMNELFARFKETLADETGKNGYLLVMNKALKKNIEFFSKALLENLFNNMMGLGLLEINSVETVYYMGRALGYLATFTKKSLIKEAIIRESHGLCEENKEEFENNVENYKALCNILGVLANKNLEFDEETMKLVEKISEDVFAGLNGLKNEVQVDFCMRFFKRIDRDNGKVKTVVLRKKLVEKTRKEIKEKFKAFELI